MRNDHACSCSTFRDRYVPLSLPDSFNVVSVDVLYPFVTTEKRHSAYYLFEGGYFSLYTP